MSVAPSVFYASGNSGPDVRADGNGGALPRGYYRRMDDGRNVERICDDAPLTKTQKIILLTARDAPGGVVAFGRGDRNGTRVATRDEMGVPLIIAYQRPEIFLQRRGLLAAANARHHYRITDLGRAVLERLFGQGGVA